MPCTFPSILVNSTTGIAVGMASSICSFNLKEVCKTTAEIIKNPEHDVLTTLVAPDFPGGGEIIYDKEKLKAIYETGRGGIKIRAKYEYDKKYNCIDIKNIPPTTTSEVIIEKIAALVKEGKIREISDVRDETGLDGLKITIDLKRGSNPESLMRKLFRLTPLEDTFSCNFNVLIAETPKVMGVKEIITEWIAFREECIKRRTVFDLQRLNSKLHLLEGLEKILVDIDKAILIIRKTKEEINVVPNLMEGFLIDKIQAEYVADIKLRHLNREYILKRTNEIESIKNEIKKLKEILEDKSKVDKLILEDLKRVAETYGKERVCPLVMPEEIITEEITVPDYPVSFFVSKEGYFKKITPQSLKMNSEQNLKSSDEILEHIHGTNHSDLLFFTDKAQVYKAKAYNFKDTKASQVGDYIPATLSFDKNEKFKYMVATTDYSGFMVFFFESGKVAKVDMKSYLTKTNRKKLIKAYFEGDKLVFCDYSKEEKNYILTSSCGKILIFSSGKLSLKQTKSTQGIMVMKQKKGHRLLSAQPYVPGSIENESAYYAKNLPYGGKLPLDDSWQQMTIG